MKIKLIKSLCLILVLSLLLSAFCIFVSGCKEEHVHVWSNGELTQEASETESGEITYTCISCKSKKSETIEAGTKITTRADLEEALVATAWAYYMKKDAIQYDSAELSMISKTSGGLYRQTNEVSPEYGTSDTTIFSVCSTYTSSVYLEGIGRRIFEGKYSPNGIYTSMLWSCSENQPEKGYCPFDATSPDKFTNNDVDTAILRWVNYSRYVNDEASNLHAYNNMSVNSSSAFTDWYKDGNLQFKYNSQENTYEYILNGTTLTAKKSKDLVRAFLSKTVNGEYVNLRRGDLLVDEGHVVIYVGNGIVLDCWGLKYNTQDGTDIVETSSSSAVYGRIASVTNELAGATCCFSVVRPLEFYAQDFDGNMDNDIVKYNGEMIEVPTSTKSRIKFPAMDINRTVDATPYGTVSKGDTLTYKVVITNNTNERYYSQHSSLSTGTNRAYENLKVTEAIPAGTEFVSANGEYQLNNGVLTWMIDVPAQSSVEISYTVKATGDVGSIITNDSGYVDDIPSNSISNLIGKNKLNSDQIEFLQILANDENTNSWASYGSGLEFANNIYNAMNVNLNLPTIENVIQNVFTPTYIEIPKLSIYYGEVIKATMYRLQKTVAEQFIPAKQMLVNGYYGGYRVFATDTEKLNEVGLDNFDFATECNNVILDFSTKYLEVGDIIVYATAKDRGQTTLTHEVAESTTFIYAGNDTLLCAKTNLDNTTEYSILKGDLATAELVKCYKNTNDLFFTLRPSQVMDLSN